MPLAFVALTALMLAAATPQPATGPLELKAPGRPGQGEVAAYPQVLPGPATTPAAAARVNDLLAEDQEETQAAAAACRARRAKAPGAGAPGAWTRAVRVTMRGPRFLSLTAVDSFDCGDGHPGKGLETPLVFDLQEGYPAAWPALFPPGAQLLRADAADGSVAFFVMWAELARRSRRTSPASCVEAFADEDWVPYAIALDARTGALIAKPAELPPAMHACAAPVSLPAAELRRLKFDPELARALEAARRLQR